MITALFSGGRVGGSFDNQEKFCKLKKQSLVDVSINIL